MCYEKRNLLATNSSLITAKLKWSFFLPICLLVFAIWLPFGFSQTGLIEEWGILGLFSDSGPIFFGGINSPFALQALRPFTVLPHSIAFSLDPNSFFYWQILLIAALVVKGAATANLVCQATNSWRFAIIAGLLIIVYPADTMQLSMRALHINWALACLLFASTLFVSAFYSSKTIKAYTLALLSAILLWVSLAMYEACIALVLCPFFMIYVKDGLKNSLKQSYKAKNIISLWGLSIALYLIYVGITAPKIDSYQHSLLADYSLLGILQANIFKLFSPGMTRSLLGGWVDAVQMVYKEIDFLGYVYLLIVIGLIFSLCHYLVKSGNKEGRAPVQQSSIPTRLALVGILALLLGYAPYLISSAHTNISQRTFLFASAGAVLFWISLLMLLAKWQKMLASIVAILLVTIGLGMQLFQFHHYQQISERQRTILRNIVTNFDGQLNKKTLLLLDGSNQLTSTWMLPNLKGALSYFYEKPINAVKVCYMPGKEWYSFSFAFMLHGSCIEQEKKWIFRAPTKITSPNDTSLSMVPDEEILKKETVVLFIKPDGSIDSDPSLKGYRANLTKISNPAKRYQEILIVKKWPSYFKQFWTQDMEKYSWSFGNWWSMEIPIRGSGWSEALWSRDKFKYRASAWKAQENATLLFDLQPRKSTYSLQGQFGFFISEAVRNSVQIYLNDHLISYQWLSLNKFSAVIPADVLSTGHNKITFHSVTEPKINGLSLSLAWFELSPNAQLRKEKL